MYTMRENVRYSEVDHTRNITLPGIINYFQDCSIRHSEAIGFGLTYLEQFHKGWVLTSWQVVVNRYPTLGEEVEVGTYPTEFKGLYGVRNFYMRDEAGNMLAYANSIWAFMDLEKGRPCRPDPKHIEAYQVEPPLPMDYKGRKIELPEEAPEVGEPFPVLRSQIDTNEHVNNCEYVQMALEVLEKPMKVKELRVEYKKSAVYGNMITPSIIREEKRTVVELMDEEGHPYAVVELVGEENTQENNI